MRLTLALLSFTLMAADPALTVYNQNFGVVREIIPLALQQGENAVKFTGVTAWVEPESVILRDAAGQVALRILEQNYRADPVSMEALLAAHEGREIDFLVQRADRTEVVRATIVRAGFAAGPSIAPRWAPDGSMLTPAGAIPGQPIVRMDGKLRFQLPGIPLFPPLPAETILKPTIDWVIHAGAAAKLDAELSYLSGGLNWEADYNLVAPQAGDALEITGWVTLENRSGRAFENARIKLMAGDVSKLAPRRGVGERFAAGGVVGGVPGYVQVPAVTEKTFDEYHLYTLPRPTTLHDRQTKQVEFIRANGVGAKILYVYDGAKIDFQRYMHAAMEAIRQDASYGTQSNPKVWVMREFANTEANRLGVPLPKGRVRFYRRDTGGRLEFTGEDEIRHTPSGETVRVFSGAAFDLVGERRRTVFRIDHGRSTAEESFEIKVRNRKKEAVDVRIVEHLYRWTTWELRNPSEKFDKTDAQTVEFQVAVPPGGEKTLTYTVVYTW